MNLTDVPQKTQLGTDEIQARRHALSQRERSMLILVDGRKSVANLLNLTKGLDNSQMLLSTLVNAGLVEIDSSIEGKIAASEFNFKMGVDIQIDEPDIAAQNIENNHKLFREAIQHVNDKVVGALGIRSFTFMLKLQKCSNIVELIWLLHDNETRFKLAMGDNAYQNMLNYVEQRLQTTHIA